MAPGMLRRMELTTVLLALACLALSGLSGALLLARTTSARGSVPPLPDPTEVLEGLDRLSDQMRSLDREQAQWRGLFHQQVGELQRETRSLSTALRRPQVRGRWGELHLRRAVELAGLVDRCDFAEQVSLADGTRRPDLVVTLAGGRQVVVDAKVPLDAYLDATSSEDDGVRREALARHARQLRTHVDALAAKSYWRALPETPEFVVLFVPAESFLAAALETDGSLLDYAAGRQVVLATPTTLIALLRTVAHGWRHEALADQAREIHRLGQELHERLGTMSSHLDDVGRALTRAVGAYNQAMGSLESRVMVSARRFGALTLADDEVVSPRQVEATTRRAPGLEAPGRADDAADPGNAGQTEVVRRLDRRAAGDRG